MGMSGGGGGMGGMGNPASRGNFQMPQRGGYSGSPGYSNPGIGRNPVGAGLGGYGGMQGAGRGGMTGGMGQGMGRGGMGGNVQGMGRGGNMLGGGGLQISRDAGRGGFQTGGMQPPPPMSQPTQERQYWNGPGSQPAGTGGFSPPPQFQRPSQSGFQTGGGSPPPQMPQPTNGGDMFNATGMGQGGSMGTGGDMGDAGRADAFAQLYGSNAGFQPGIQGNGDLSGERGMQSAARGATGDGNYDPSGQFNRMQSLAGANSGNGQTSMGSIDLSRPYSPSAPGGQQLGSMNLGGQNPAAYNPAANGFAMSSGPARTQQQNPAASGGLLNMGGAQSPASGGAWNGFDAQDNLTGNGAFDWTAPESGSHYFSSGSLGQNQGLGANMWLTDQQGRTVSGDPNAMGMAGGRGALNATGLTPGQQYRVNYAGGSGPFRMSGNRR